MKRLWIPLILTAALVAALGVAVWMTGGTTGSEAADAKEGATPGDWESRWERAASRAVPPSGMGPEGRVALPDVAWSDPLAQGRSDGAGVGEASGYTRRGEPSNFPNNAGLKPASGHPALLPLPGLSDEEQRRANEEANAYALPVVEFLGKPDVGNQEESASGGRRPPPELEAELDRDATAVQKVRLNKIGLARVNEQRAAGGLPPLVAGRDVQIAPVGMDLVTVPVEETMTETREGNDAGLKSGGSGGDSVENVEGIDFQKLGGSSGVVDNSTLQYFPPIRDQGSVDSCVGWSEIYYATTHAVAMTYGWDAKNGGDDYRFAPLFTYNFLNEGKSQYTYFTTHFDIARYHGVVRWSQMPDSTDFRSWVTDEDAYLDALRTKTNGYTTIYNMSTTGIQTLKDALDNGHVAAFATFFRGWVFDTTDNDPNTTADDTYVGLKIAHNLNNTRGGHAFVIVGYNDHIWLDLNNDGVVDANEKGGFKVANSDGTGWQNGGYAYITYDVVRNYSTIVGHDGDGLIWQNRVRIAQAKPVQHQPTVVALITLNHNKRNQVKCQLGTSTTSSTTPTSLVTTKILTNTPYETYFQGGAYAFSGAAAASQDFTYYLDFSDNVPAPGSPRRFHVNVTDSGTNDGNLTVKEFDLYYHTGGAYYLVGSADTTPAVANGSTSTVWIDWTVGEVKPGVSVTASDATAAEEGVDPGVWTITRDGDLTNPLTVLFSFGGTATSGLDYTVNFPTSVTIPANQASANVTLTPVDDAVFSEVEFAAMTLTADNAYVILTPDPVAIAIADNDNHSPVVEAGDHQTLMRVGGTAWSPLQLAPAGWYDAGDSATLQQSGGSVSQWRDKSGNNLDLAQTDPARQPQIGIHSINGINTLKFDGDVLASSRNPFTTSIEDAFVITVHRIDATTNGSLFNLNGTLNSPGRWQAHAPWGSTLYFDAGSASGGARLGSNYGVGVGDEVIVSFYGSTTDNVQQIYKNGSLLAGDSSGHSTTVTGNAIYIGAGSATQYFQNTSIAEMIIINGTVSAEDRQNLEGYLAHKWGQAHKLPADHPQKTAPPGGGGVSVNLDGSVADQDGGTPAAQWTVVSGPGPVLFANQNAVATTATITAVGTYVLQLTADDGFGPVVDQITITVSEAGADIDGNGIDDAWEFQFFGSVGSIDGSADNDSDGVPDFFEYLYGSAPNNAGDNGFRLAATAGDGGGPAVFRWETLEHFTPGTDYSVWVSTNLTQWDPLPAAHYTLVPSPNGSRTSYELSLTHDYGDNIFLRLVKP